MQTWRIVLGVAVLGVATLGGCASSPPAQQTGFLSDYSRLEEKDSKRASYVSPELRNYQAFIIDPVEFRVPPAKLSPAERAEVAKHFHRRLVQLLEKRGYTIVEDPDVAVARVRIAMTDVARSTWWQKLHPAMRASGAGTGGASMEAEVIDSVTGEQFGAVVQASPGSQFDLTAFSTVGDVNSAIDKWADQAGRRLDELRAQAG
jgi:hypothetical protein